MLFFIQLMINKYRDRSIDLNRRGSLSRLPKIRITELPPPPQICPFRPLKKSNYTDDLGQLQTLTFLRV